MKNPLTRITFFLGVILLYSSCDSQLIEVTDRENPRDYAPLATSTEKGPPDSSGVHVIRTESEFGIRFINFETGNAALFGIDLQKLCSAEYPFSPASNTEISTTQELDRIISLLKGKSVNASLWNPFPRWSPTYCAEILMGTDLIAKGTGRVVIIDTDRTGYPDGVYNNAHIFRSSAVASLVTPEEDSLRINAHIVCVKDGSDAHRRRCKSKLVINGL